MITAFNYVSELDLYKTSTDAILARFRNGRLYAENRELYFATVISVCDYFGRHIINVEKFVNAISNDAEKYVNVSEILDFINEAFSTLEDYAEYICNDFADFEKTLAPIIAKESLSYRCNLNLNCISQRVKELPRMVERNSTILLGNYITQLTDDQLMLRAS